MTIEFFYDIASPYTFLAMTKMAALEEETGATVLWRPFLLGAVFKATGNTPPALVPARGSYMLGDLYRWARLYNEPFNFPSNFPANSLLAMRALMALPVEERPDPSLALARAYWADGEDPADAEVVAKYLGADAVAAAADHKVALKENTDEAIKRGAFGAPTFFVGKSMYFGNDRLDFLKAKVTQA